MSNQIAAGHLSAALKEMGFNCDVLNTPAEVVQGRNVADIENIHSLLLKNTELYACYPITTADQSSKLDRIYVISLVGKRHTVYCNLDLTTGSFKTLVQPQLEMPQCQMRLIFCGQQLEDDRTLSSYGIKGESVLHLTLRLRGGGMPKISSDQFDARFHYDFSKIKDAGMKFERGGRPYQRPCGWYRYAFKVLGKFENDDWLGANKARTSSCASVSGEWPVSYHGTSYHNGLSIAQSGYELSKSKRQMYGKGIYSTPDLSTAEGYAQEYEFEGKIYQIILQNRVNPTNLQIIPGTTTKFGEYWVCPNEKDVRPYAMCIREKPKIPN